MLVKTFTKISINIILFLLSFHYFNILNAQASRPNIIVILTDDQNTETVGCYENLVSTPNIDSLAKDGIKFTSANVVSSVCSPSRYNLLTGRYYNHSYSDEFLELYPKGVATCINNFMVLERDNMNFPAILRDNGYTTGFVGKFHLADHHLLTTNSLWEENGLQTYPADSDPRENSLTNQKLQENHQRWVERISGFGFDYVNGVYAANTRELFNDYLKSHNIEWTVFRALDFIDQQTTTEKPFFLIVNTTYPHGPAPEREVDGEYPNSLDHDMRLTGEGVFDEVFDVMPSRQSVKDRFNELKVQNPDLPQNAMTAIWWDDAVGSIVNALDNNGLRENTLIIYLSDHGKMNNGKTTLYETGVHIPMIMNWDGIKSPGREYNHLTAILDIGPTILDVAGAEIPERMEMDGISLKPVLEGSNNAVREALLLEMGYARAIKTEKYKYIAVRYPEEIEKQIELGVKFPDVDGELTLDQPYLILHKNLASKAASSYPNYFDRNQVYDLSLDPNETNNIYRSDPEVDEHLKELLKKELELFPFRPFGEFNNSTYKHECEKLSYNSPTSTLIEEELSDKASNRKLVNLYAAHVEDEIVFDVPVNESGNYIIELNSLSSNQSGKYTFSIESSDGTWTTMDGVFDMYNANTDIVAYRWGPVELTADNKFFHLYNAGHDILLKSSDGTALSGVNSTYSGEDAEWIQKKANDNYVYIIHSASQKKLADENGTPVLTSSSNSDNIAQWEIQDAVDGCIFIGNRSTQNRLQYTGDDKLALASSTAEGKWVQWKFLETADAYVRFSYKCTGKNVYSYGYEGAFDFIRMIQQNANTSNEIELPISTNLSFYPNPARDKLIITSPENYSSAFVYNITGNIVLSFSEKRIIDISRLSNGVYLLKIDQNYDKFIKI